MPKAKGVDAPEEVSIGLHRVGPGVWEVTRYRVKGAKVVDREVLIPATPLHDAIALFRVKAQILIREVLESVRA